MSSTIEVISEYNGFKSGDYIEEIYFGRLRGKIIYITKDIYNQIIFKVEEAGYEGHPPITCLPNYCTKIEKNDLPVFNKIENPKLILLY
jgi:hypothetical protein